MGDIVLKPGGEVQARGGVGGTAVRFFPLNSKLVPCVRPVCLRLVGREPVFSTVVIYIVVQTNVARETSCAATIIPQYMTLFALDQL